MIVLTLISDWCELVIDVTRVSYHYGSIIITIIIKLLRLGFKETDSRSFCNI